MEADRKAPVTITSEPVRRAQARRTRGFLRYRDRTCWSLKVAAQCRNLSGTAGIVFTRLKKKVSSWGVFFLPPPQGEGDREAVVGVCLQWQDTPPVSFADSRLRAARSQL